MSKAQWSSFWVDEKKAFLQVMQISTTVFARRLDELLKFKHSHNVLDYGCGPGFLMDHLVTKDVVACGVDINPFYINECKKKGTFWKLCQITTDINKNHFLLKNEFKDIKFDFIVLLSVIQYFEDGEYLENTIQMLSSLLKDNGKIVIADVVDSDTSSIIDGLTLFGHCLKSGKLYELAKFSNYLIQSEYNSLSRQIKLKQFTSYSIDQIAHRCSMKSTRINGLTVHPTRSSYILTKSSIQ